MNFSLPSYLVSVGLMLLQLLLAMPWVLVVFLTPAGREELRRKLFVGWFLQPILIAAIACLAAPFLLYNFILDRDSLETTGRVYSAMLQLQITIDLFIALFLAVIALWPKGGAVALAAFREGIRQWVFWLLFLIGLMLMSVSVFVPYFTFGEDYLMVKQLGYDTIMLVAVLFGGLTASLSISEEIEGRTAITVMSKPVSRRQFMVGKFVGISMAALFMFGLLGVYFEGVLVIKHWWDKLDPFTVEATKESLTVQQRIGVVATPAWVSDTLSAWAFPSATTDLLRGIGQWIAHTADTMPGLVLCFSQVLVLVGLSVALATRLPMVVNLTSVLVVFFLSHLTPVLLAISRKAQETQPNAPVPRLIGFVANVFNTILPDLQSFQMDPALLSDSPPPPLLFAQYAGAVTLYGIVYTTIVLLLGLILFEDRDLA